MLSADQYRETAKLLDEFTDERLVDGLSLEMASELRRIALVLLRRAREAERRQPSFETVSERQ